MSRAASAPPARRRRLIASLLCVPLLPLGACGGSEGGRDRARAELEAEFGRRTEPAAQEPGAPAVESSARPESGRQPSSERAEPSTRGAGAEEAAPGPQTRPPIRSETEPRDSSPEDTATADPAPGPPSVAAVDLDSLLAAAEDAYSALRSLRAAFVQRVEVPLLERTAEGRGMWYQRGRDRFRMDFEDPPDDVFVADGTYLWLYQPSQQPGQVIRSPLAAATVETGTADLLGRILSEARTGYDGVYEGTEPVSGVSTHHLALTPRAPSGYREVQVWIASADALVRRFRIVEENETVRTVTLSRLEPQVPLADSLFRFEPPPGAQVFER